MVFLMTFTELPLIESHGGFIPGQCSGLSVIHTHLLKYIKIIPHLTELCLLHPLIVKTGIMTVAAKISEGCLFLNK